MNISHTNKFIYIAIPKTGSSSIRKFTDSSTEYKRRKAYYTGMSDTTFGDVVSGYYQDIKIKLGTHSKMQELKSVWPEVFPLYPSYEDYFKFTYVRNPWDRRVSQWNFIKRCSRLPKSRKKHTWSAYCLFVRNQCKDSFGNFVKKSSKLDQQINWIYDDVGNNLLDYVGKLEEIDTSLEIIAPRLGIDFDGHIPYINKSPGLHYSTYYDSKLVDIVGDFYSDDISAFNYDFESV
jgi:hypothetical protein